MKRLLPLLAVIALVAAACGGNDADSGVASLEAAADDVISVSEGDPALSLIHISEPTRPTT